MLHKAIARRDLLSGALAAASFSVVPRSALGGPGQKAPSDLLARGVVGTGGRGQAFLTPRDRRVIAVCDVDRNHLEAAARKVGSG